MSWDYDTWEHTRDSQWYFTMLISQHLNFSEHNISYNWYCVLQLWSRMRLWKARCRAEQAEPAEELFSKTFESAVQWRRPGMDWNGLWENVNRVAASPAKNQTLPQCSQSQRAKIRWRKKQSHVPCMSLPACLAKSKQEACCKFQPPFQLLSIALLTKLMVT